MLFAVKLKYLFEVSLPLDSEEAVWNIVLWKSWFTFIFRNQTHLGHLLSTSALAESCTWVRQLVTHWRRLSFKLFALNDWSLPDYFIFTGLSSFNRHARPYWQPLLLISVNFHFFVILFCSFACAIIGCLYGVISNALHQQLLI